MVHLLVSDQPGSVRDLALMWMETHYAPFAGLLGTVRAGDCAATAHYGQPYGLGDRDNQMRALFESAGFVYDGVASTPTPISIVQAHLA
jgi:hypothetical protein